MIFAIAKFWFVILLGKNGLIFYLEYVCKVLIQCSDFVKWVYFKLMFTFKMGGEFLYTNQMQIRS